MTHYGGVRSFGGAGGIGAEDIEASWPRLAQRNWLDPHPDAIATTWEFSTYADMNQAALESAGWTFAGCSGALSEGILWLSNTSGATWATASLAVSLTGDFDYFAAPLWPAGYGTNIGSLESTQVGGMGVGDVSNDVAHYSLSTFVNGYGRATTYKDGVWTTGGGTGASATIYGSPSIVRVSRVSGTVYLCGAQHAAAGATLLEDDTTPQGDGWSVPASVSDADTYTKVFLCAGYRAIAKTGIVCGFYFLRRFQ